MDDEAPVRVCVVILDVMFVSRYADTRTVETFSPGQRLGA